jgi:hypothetical protein
MSEPKTEEFLGISGHMHFPSDYNSVTGILTANDGAHDDLYRVRLNFINRWVEKMAE